MKPVFLTFRDSAARLNHLVAWIEQHERPMPRAGHTVPAGLRMGAIYLANLYTATSMLRERQYRL